MQTRTSPKHETTDLPLEDRYLEIALTQAGFEGTDLYRFIRRLLTLVLLCVDRRRGNGLVDQVRHESPTRLYLFSDDF